MENQKLAKVLNVSQAEIEALTSVQPSTINEMNEMLKLADLLQDDVIKISANFDIINAYMKELDSLAANIMEMINSLDQQQ